jgi:hypothetical protein
MGAQADAAIPAVESSRVAATWLRLGYTENAVWGEVLPVRMYTREAASSSSAAHLHGRSRRLQGVQAP